MRAKHVLWVLGASVALAACGGGPSNPNDEGSLKCTYNEVGDATNSTDAEATMLSIKALDENVLCGSIDVGHYDAGTKTVDADHYRITTDGMYSLLVRGSTTGALPADTDLEVLVFSTDASPTLLNGAVTSATADHSAFIAALPPGTYDVVVLAKATADLPAAIPYKIRLSPDDPMRCPVVTDKANYTEANDGDGTANDVIASQFQADQPWVLTDVATDAAEVTSLTIDAEDPFRISGSAAMVNAADAYMDRDTYLVTTGKKVNELTLRLTWLDAGTDLDFAVFPADQAAAAGDGLLTEPMQEYNAVPVSPDTSYWIWIGAHDGSSVLPEAYDLSLCGTVFTP
jgi:hypothetical protein